MTEKLVVENLYRSFGPEPDEALRLPRQGLSVGGNLARVRAVARAGFYKDHVVAAFVARVRIPVDDLHKAAYDARETSCGAAVTGTSKTTRSGSTAGLPAGSGLRGNPANPRPVRTTASQGQAEGRRCGTYEEPPCISGTTTRQAPH